MANVTYNSLGDIVFMCSKLVPPVKRSNVSNRDFPVAGPKNWNALKDDVW